MFIKVTKFKFIIIKVKQFKCIISNLTNLNLILLK